METLRILWMNWRCIRHPLAGGAEVYTHEIARRLAREGHEVVLVTSRPKGLPREEVIDGYKVIRSGGRLTVYYRAKKIYEELKRSGWRPDIVVDEVNTIPFMTPRYVSEPIMMLIHQLCKECWKYAVHPLAQPLGWWLEKRLHKIYVEAVKRGRVKAVVTVSPSTKADLVSLGYPEQRIHIVPNAVDPEKYRACNEYSREKEDLVVYTGRITPYKRIEDILQAWRIVQEQHPGAKLVIAGRPDKKYLKKLEKLKQRLGLKNVWFETNISHHRKLELLGHAKTQVYTSTREGWGQTIMEAALCRTPTIAYNVPGLRDSVKHMQTGILVQPGNTEQLAQAIQQLLREDDLREKLAENAYRQARQYTWQKTMIRLQETIEAILNG